MAAVLDVEALEGSTYVVTASFTDEDGDPVAPNSVTWTLTDSDGDVVNGRLAVVVTPASSVNVVLYGDDLEASPPDGGYLLFTVEATYDSALGSVLPLKGQARLVVQELEP